MRKTPTTGFISRPRVLQFATAAAPFAFFVRDAQAVDGPNFVFLSG
jgi:hypothetical protein